jgi:glyoxylase-like metal-dependent hydrolase (beta-lactamase superfamily II)
MIKSFSDAHINSRFYTVSNLDTIEVGDLRFEVIETPGHSRGGLCFFERTERVLFSGDTLFAGSIGRTDHPGGDYDLLMKSIFEKIIPLDDEPSDSGPDSASGSRHTSIQIIPGHGPCTDLATEGMTNPFLQPFNLPYDDE